MKKITKILTVTALLALLASLTFSMAAVLNQRDYTAHFSIGEGILPKVDFGLYTDNGTEMNLFNFAGLMPQSVMQFQYTLKQKSSYNITTYMRWSYTILPISWLTIDMLWNGTEWSYTDAMLWHTTDNIPITFIINVGDINNTAWDCSLRFTVSSTP